MTRTRRLILPAASSISLLFCALSITMWFRSYGGSDYLARNKIIDADIESRTTQIHSIAFTRGSLRFSFELQILYSRWNTTPSELTAHPAYWSHGRLGRGHLGWNYLDDDNRRWFNLLGFHYIETGHGASFYEASEKILAIPAWLVTLIFAVPPMILLRRVIRCHRRKIKRLCPQCGYDLRATPAQCPECGHSTS